MPATYTLNLATGQLQLSLSPGKIPLHRLLGFASRISSQRKFLLVSKVLGKHYPVSPKLMAWSYRALARATLQHSINGHSVWIGMAETATGLGYGVYAAAHYEGLQNGLFMQTTRYHLDGLPYLAFDEAHSHATDFFLYYPEQQKDRQHFLNAKTLVLIDDEISTGRTFMRLINAYQAVNPNLQTVFIVSLVNFASPEDRRRVETGTAINVQWVFLREGLLNFEPIENTPLDNMRVHVSSNNTCKKHLLGWPGRLGITQPIQLNPEIDETLKAIGINLTSDDPRPLAVLGTGECNAPAFLLAQYLAGQGFNVKVQSTTRSPIHVGNAIGSVQQFEDNYEDGIANFIYNLNPADYHHIILCHETPLNPPLQTLLSEWGAMSARFEHTPDADYAKIHFFRPR